ncbi:hypothetical protein [Burkholderia ambifaria]|uniref:Uncharacterized protein n=1 Tax=Burkholderia ambifaria MEX-5 TaxID=396597 RepID=B1TFS2_9BURK|nr:hypothetical protein [Burkholderia ambifaria]EDT37585.1 conserved hypothetical protein [Burkholderia ambifaria MEX-5]
MKNEKEKVREMNVVHAESKISNHPADFQPNFQYDSGWNWTDNATEHLLTFTHRLGVAPSLISIFFSPDQESLYPLIWPWAYQQTGNPVSILVNTTAIKLTIWNRAPLHGAWEGEAGPWKLWDAGYFRVFASR